MYLTKNAIMDKQQFKLSVVDYKSFDSNLNEEKCVRNGDYVLWGKNNDFPKYLYDTYLNCATLQSIINGLSLIHI